MKDNIWRRGGLIDFTSLELHSKVGLIFVLLLLQFFVLPYIGLIIVFAFITLIIFPFFGVIPPSFMDEAPPLIGWVLIALMAFAAFVVSSLPVALYFKLPSKIILLLAILCIPEVLLSLALLVHLPG